MKLIEKEFDSYRKEVIHPDASEIQIKGTEMAFYGGAIALYNILMTKLSDESDDATEEDFDLFDEISNELNEYYDLIKNS